MTRAQAICLNSRAVRFSSFVNRHALFVYILVFCILPIIGFLVTS